MIFDLKKLEAVDRAPGGVAGFVSFQRLATEVFRAAGEIRPNETITHFEIRSNGIQFYIETAQ